jgi:hypothetical protein
LHSTSKKLILKNISLFKRYPIKDIFFNFFLNKVNKYIINIKTLKRYKNMSSKKNIIVKALSFWKNKLNESEQTTESEEDQKKEAAKEQGNQEQAEIDAADNQDEKYSPEEDFENSMSSDDSIEAFDNLSQDSDTESDDTESDDTESDNEDSDTEDLDTEDLDTENSGDDSDEDESGEESDDDNEESDDTESEDEVDSHEDQDDSDDESDDEDEDDEDEDDEDEDDDKFKLEVESSNKKIVDYIPELCKKFGSKLSITISGVDSDDDEGRFAATIVCQDEETFNAVKEDETIKAAVSGELNESIKYTPNTVGAVVKLLNKSDPNDFLFIRLAPNMKQCMIYDIDRSIAANGQSTTYLEIAIGNPNK